MKICGKECPKCQPYNDSWCVCWQKKIKGSRVQMGVRCTVEKVKEDEEESKERYYASLIDPTAPE